MEHHRIVHLESVHLVIGTIWRIQLEENSMIKWYNDTNHKMIQWFNDTNNSPISSSIDESSIHSISPIESSLTFQNHFSPINLHQSHWWMDGRPCSVDRKRNPCQKWPNHDRNNCYNNWNNCYNNWKNRLLQSTKNGEILSGVVSKVSNSFLNFPHLRAINPTIN